MEGLLPHRGPDRGREFGNVCQGTSLPVTVEKGEGARDGGKTVGSSFRRDVSLEKSISLSGPLLSNRIPDHP